MKNENCACKTGRIEPVILVRIGECAYRPYNKRTQRFHNIELGIDVVY